MSKEIFSNNTFGPGNRHFFRTPRGQVLPFRPLRSSIFFAINSLAIEIDVNGAVVFQTQ
jgi:hypothetical protein